MTLPLVTITCLAAGALAALAFLRVLLRLSSLVHVQWPRCGNCGYSVVGLPTATCPECGMDLNDAGIRAPRMRGRLRGLWCVLGWCAFALTAMTLTSSVIASVAPRAVHQVENRRRVVLVSRTGDYRILVNIVACADGSVRTPGAIQMSLFGPDGEYVSDVEIDVPMLRCRYQRTESLGVPEPLNVDGGGLFAWLRQGGIDTKEDEAQSGSAELVRFIRDVASGADLYVASQRLEAFETLKTYSRQQAELPAWVDGVQAIAWGTVWIYGLRRFFRKETQTGARSLDRDNTR